MPRAVRAQTGKTPLALRRSGAKSTGFGRVDARKHRVWAGNFALGARKKPGRALAGCRAFSAAVCPKWPGARFGWRARFSARAGRTGGAPGTEKGSPSGKERLPFPLGKAGIHTAPNGAAAWGLQQVNGHNQPRKHDGNRACKLDEDVDGGAGGIFEGVAHGVAHHGGLVLLRALAAVRAAFNILFGVVPRRRPRWTSSPPAQSR